MIIKIVNKSNHDLPSYETIASAGMDLRASLKGPVVLNPGGRMIIPTDLYMEIPVGYEAQIRPRSGLAAKTGITVLNAPGTIDADYRGNVGVILCNLGDKIFTVADGLRIAQMVITQHERAQWDEVDEIIDLTATGRGPGGFGSTGKD